MLVQPLYARFSQSRVLCYITAFPSFFSFHFASLEGRVISLGRAVDNVSVVLPVSPLSLSRVSSAIAISQVPALTVYTRESPSLRPTTLPLPLFRSCRSSHCCVSNPLPSLACPVDSFYLSFVVSLETLWSQRMFECMVMHVPMCVCVYVQGR